MKNKAKAAIAALMTGVMLTTSVPIQASQKPFPKIPLSAEFQSFVIEKCEQENISPEFVFAIVEVESGYQTGIVGDYGKSYGLMQIQPKWNRERMKRIGCTNLLDPYENVAVGIDILSEYFRQYEEASTVLLVYNGGEAYMRRMESGGGYISEYAQKVFDAQEKLYEGRNY